MKYIVETEATEEEIVVALQGKGFLPMIQPCKPFREVVEMNEDDNMTDAEAWAVLGATIEGARFVNTGLCHVLVDARGCGLISTPQAYRMRKDLYDTPRLLGVKHQEGYFWPRGQVAPRVRACYKLAGIAARKARA